MDVIIRFIKPSDMRYATVGDYYIEKSLVPENILDPEGLVIGTIMKEEEVQVVEVADMGNEDYNILVALHELIELTLCKKRGITEESIMNFDLEFEAARPEGNTDEPGNDINAPYKKEHEFATKVETMMAEQLGVDWDTYDNVVVNLEVGPDRVFDNRPILEKLKDRTLYPMLSTVKHEASYKVQYTPSIKIEEISNEVKRDIWYEKYKKLNESMRRAMDEVEREIWYGEYKKLNNNE